MDHPWESKLRSKERRRDILGSAPRLYIIALGRQRNAQHAPQAPRHSQASVDENHKDEPEDPPQVSDAKSTPKDKQVISFCMFSTLAN